MPDASGTPSANYLIPKFNTAVDPPSGKGTNTIVDFVDTLLKNTFINKPAGILTGETPVWNSGSGTWDRSSTTKIASGSFAGILDADIGASANIGYRKRQGFPAVQLFRTAAQSITSALQAPLNYDTVEFSSDPNTIYSNTSGTVTINETGWYLFTGYINFAGSIAGATRLALLVHSALGEIARGFMSPGFTAATVSQLIHITSGQSIHLDGYQDSSTTMNMTGRLSIVMVSR